jgi:hypothetical protein
MILSLFQALGTGTPILRYIIEFVMQSAAMLIFYIFDMFHDMIHEYVCYSLSVLME